MSIQRSGPRCIYGHHYCGKEGNLSLVYPKRHYCLISFYAWTIFLCVNISDFDLNSIMQTPHSNSPLSFGSIDTTDLCMDDKTKIFKMVVFLYFSHADTYHRCIFAYDYFTKNNVILVFSNLFRPSICVWALIRRQFFKLISSFAAWVANRCPFWRTG